MPDDMILPFAKTRDGAVSRRGFAALGLGAGLAGATAALSAELLVTETEVAIKTADGLCDAVVIAPEGGHTHPGAIIFTDILGLRPAFRAMGRQLAAQGYAVLVPNPFYRTRKAPVLDGPFDFTKPEDRAKLVELTKPLTSEAKAHDIAAYLTFIDTHRAVNTKAKIGVAGYCMGGPYTMMAAAASSRVGAAGSFHGGGLVIAGPDSPHLLVPKMKAAYYFGVAGNDDQKQPDAKDKLKAAFSSAHLPAKIEVYATCQHGWCVPDGAAYNKAEADRAFAELVALYRAALI